MFEVTGYEKQRFSRKRVGVNNPETYSRREFFEFPNSTSTDWQPGVRSLRDAWGGVMCGSLLGSPKAGEHKHN